VRDGGGREETAASSGDDRSVRERRSVVRRRRTTGENNDLGGEGKHAAQVHLTALLPQPPAFGFSEHSSRRAACGTNASGAENAPLRERPALFCAD